MPSCYVCPCARVHLHVCMGVCMCVHMSVQGIEEHIIEWLPNWRFVDRPSFYIDLCLEPIMEVSYVARNVLEQLRELHAPGSTVQLSSEYTWSRYVKRRLRAYARAQLPDLTFTFSCS